MKKLCFFLLSGLLCAATMTSQAQSGTTGDLSWTIAGGALTISGEGAMPDYEWMGSPWFENTFITTIIIYDGVTTIGNYAFCYCSSLTEVTIPNSVTTIGVGAFSYCSSLTEVTIPNSITTIGSYAFLNCSSLTSINVDEDNDDFSSIGGVLFNKNQTTLIQYPGNKQGEYSIPNSVTTIGDCAFYNCSSLTEVTIPNSVTTIGDMAFYGCSSLTEVTIGNSVTTIGSQTFSRCSSLTEVTIPNSVTTIEIYTFDSCSSLTKITNHSSVPQTINANVFSYVTISQITLLVPAAFAPAYRAADVWKDFNIVGIGDPACESIIASGYVTEDMTWVLCDGGTLTISGSGAMPNWSGGATPWFEHNYSITHAIIEAGVTSIGNNAFYACPSLTEVTIPNSVTTIEWSAFEFCFSLTEIFNLSAIPQTIDIYVFSGVPKNSCTLYVPTGSISAYLAAAGWSEFTNILALGSIPAVITIKEQPAAITEVSECYIAGSLSVSAVATQDATLGYQWYISTTASNEGGILIAGANNASFALPSNLRAGTHYLYCEVVAAYEATPVTSEIATVHVAPEFILAEIQPKYLSYGYSGEVISVEMSCASEGLDYSYQWYSNTNESNTGGTQIPGATSASYTLPANLVMGNYYYYYCMVSAAGVAGAAKRTNAATVIVQAKGIVVTPDAGQSKKYGAAEPTFTYNHTALLGSDGISGVLGRETGEDVGEYAFTLGTLSAGDNYSLVLTDGVSFEITKADPSYNLPTDLTTYEGYLLSTIELPAGWEWETPDDEVGDVGTQTHKATFTPEDTDNYNVISGIEVAVEVMEYIHVASISFQEQYTVLAMGETKKIIFTIEPANAINKRVRWILDADIATIDEEGWITTNSAGFTNVRVFTIDGNRQADCVIFVTRVTSAEEQFLSELKIYPNPFTGEVRIVGAVADVGAGLAPAQQKGRGQAVPLQVIDTAGAVVHTQMITGDDEIINLGHLPAGAYIFRFEKDENVKTVKIIKN